MEGAKQHASNNADGGIKGCDAREVDIAMIILHVVVIILLIGNIVFVGYCLHQNKVKSVRS